MSATMREMLEAAFSEDDEKQSDKTEQTSEDQNTDETATDETPSQTETTPDQTEEKPETETESKDKSDTQKQTEGSDNADDTEKAETRTGTEKQYKAPGTWKPKVREKWNELPDDVKSQILQREQQIARGFNEIRRVKEESEEILNAVKPFEAIIAAQGGTPTTAITNMMKTAAGLQMGTPVQKAAIIKDIIQNYGIDIEVLDNVLADDPDFQQQANQMTAIQQMLDQRLAPINQVIGQLGQQTQVQTQQIQQEINSEIEQFAQNAEYFEDVRQDMGDLMELATRRGKTMSLQEAYDQAIMMNPEIRELVTRKQQQEQAAQQQQQIDKKKKAASSVSGAPAGDGSGGNDAASIRAAIEQAWSGETD